MSRLFTLEIFRIKKFTFSPVRLRNYTISEMILVRPVSLGPVFSSALAKAGLTAGSVAHSSSAEVVLPISPIC